MVIIWSTPYGSNFVHRGVLNFFFNNINRFTFHCNKKKRMKCKKPILPPPTKTEQPCFRCLFVKQEQPSFRHLPTAAKSSHTPVDYLPLFIILNPPSPRKKSNTILDKDGTGTRDPTNQTHPPSKVGTFHEMKKLERSFDRFYTILLIVYMLTDYVASQGRQQKNKQAGA